MPRAPLAALATALALATLAACGTNPPRPDAAPSPDAAAPDALMPGRWPCPARWVPTQFGGCAPAVVVCAPDGGAAPGACDGLDLSRVEPAPPADPDGGAPGTQLFRLPDGAIGGAWSALETSDAGPPPPDFAPDAGIFSCPVDWPRTADGACDPALRTDCPTGSEPVPGGVCTQTGEPSCPLGDYPKVGPEIGAAPVAYVRAGADAASADGTAAHPDPAIGAALARAGAGGWVLIAAGTYAESLGVAASAHLVGACANRVRIAPAASVPAVTAAGAGAALDLRGVTLAGQGPGLLARDGAQVRASGVRIEGARGFGARAAGARTVVALSDAVVRGTRADPVWGPGRALEVDGAAALTAERALLAENALHGAFARGPGAQLALTAVVARATNALDDATGEPAAVRAEGGVLLTLARVVADGNRGDGVAAQGADTMALVAASVMRGVGRDAIAARDGASLRSFRTLVADYARAGVATSGAGSTLVLEDSDVRAGRDGAVAALARGGTLNATRTVLPASPGGAIDAAGPRTDVGVTECVLARDSASSATSTPAGAVQAADAAVVAIARSALRDVARAAVVARDRDTAVLLADSVVRDPGVVLDAAPVALLARDGARVEARRTRVAGVERVAGRAINYGVIALGDSVVAGAGRAHAVEALAAGAVRVDRSALRGAGGAWSDGAGSTVALADTLVGVSGVSWGGALAASRSGALEATRVVVEGAREFGIYAHTARATLREVVVDGVATSERGLGVGVAGYGAAEVAIDRVAVLASAGAGLLVAGADQTPAAARGADAFVRGIRASTIAFADPVTMAPRGPAVAFGVHAAAGALAELERLVVLASDDAGAAVAGGALTVRDGVLASNRGAAAVASGDDSALTFERVVLTGNGRDVIERGAAVPAADVVAPPVLVCTGGPYCP